MRDGRKVTIIGAGISGLVVAYELERLGWEVQVLEAAPRIGGRILTHRFGNGPEAPFVELGAMRIPAQHRNTLAYVEKLGLTDRLGDFRTLFSEEGAYHATSQGFMRVQDTAERLVDDYKASIESADEYPYEVLLFGAWLTAIGNAIAPANFRDRLRRDISMKLVRLVATVDLRPFLRGSKNDRFDLHAFFAAHPEIRAAGSGRFNRFLDDILSETSPALTRLEGGMDQLVHRLAGGIEGPIICGAPVTALDNRPDEVLVTTRRGGRDVVDRCDTVVCTIPFSILRGLRLTGFGRAKLDAIDEVRYWSATKVAFLCREAFWERDGITGGASFGGGKVRQTYYPPAEGDPERGAVLVASYTIGDDADVLGRMPAAQRHTVVLDEVGRMHPELHADGMIIETVSMAWGQHTWSLGAGVTRWSKDTAACEDERRAAARPEGRVYFAGEHCSRTTAWIDGAIESAVDCVMALVWQQSPSLVPSGCGREDR